MGSGGDGVPWDRAAGVCGLQHSCPGCPVSATLAPPTPGAPKQHSIGSALQPDHYPEGLWILEGFWAPLC